MPPRSLGAFLKAARSALTAPASQRPSPLTIVVGNESAAYFHSHTPPLIASLHVPLCNLERQDLVLRPELQAALSGSWSKSNTSAQGVTLDSLITLTDLPADLSAADTRWLLVDHNALTGSLAKRFQTSVVGCIDHHVDEGVVPLPVDDAADKPPRIIETCGSCASLIVDYTKDAWHHLAEYEPDEDTDRILAHLALAPILIDTTNLKSVNKTVDLDRQAASVAESILLAASSSSRKANETPFQPAYKGDSGYDRTVFFDTLSHLKSDLSTFSYGEILRKDYKQWREKTSSGAYLTCGISSVAQGLGYLLERIGDREALLDALLTHAREKELELAAVMTVQHGEGGLVRQLLLWAFTKEAVKAAKGFVETNHENLNLKPWDGGLLDCTEAEAEAEVQGEWRTCWTHDTKFSRKQVAPLAGISTPVLPEFSLKDRVIVVSGAARGLGLVQAEALLEAGARVHALDILPEPSAEFAVVAQRAETELGTSLTYHCINVREEQKLNDLIKAIADKYGRIDGLIAAAAIQQETPALEHSAADFDKIMGVNVTGVFLTAQAVARQMVRLGRKGGSLVLVASMSGTVANRGLICPAYNSSKAAVIQLGRNLASEWGEYGIRVNTISPGYIVTAMTEMFFEKFPERRTEWANGNMLGRMSTPNEYRGAAVFLLSDASSFMTGSDLRIDGGHCAW
ncbi:Exopolyphosphatase [Sporothrix epigloea]|uniref:Exopolyphosphatase n=1 Tax=Sporothrix epigloea TaxID=1892477 RepID=A0ABP0DBD0_9PEZI